MDLQNFILNTANAHAKVYMDLNQEPDNYPKQDLYECEKCGEFKLEEDFEGGTTCYDCSKPEPVEDIRKEDKEHCRKLDEQEQKYLERESFNVDEGPESESELA